MSNSPRRALKFGAVAAAAALLCAHLPAPDALGDEGLGSLSTYVQKLKQQAGAEVVPDRWLVQVAGHTVLDGGSSRTVSANQDAVLKRARAKGAKVRSTRNFNSVFNGMTVTADDASVARLLNTPGVVQVFPVLQVQRPTTVSASAKPNMAAAVGLTGASIARNEMGLTGRGIRIGIIDTGVDYDHRDLGGKGRPNSTPFPNSKVTHGYDFVGDAYDSSKAGARPVPDNQPDDCGGHGTHVAGIAAADGDPSAGGVRGVAPRATLGAYRVFGCTGPTDTEIIVAALEQAGRDKMDVVNLSLGAGFMTWPNYPTAQAVDQLTRKGIVVLAAAGNDGEQGMFSGGAPGVAASAIGVASFDNAQVTQKAFEVSNGRKVGYAVASGAPTPPTSGTMKLAVGGAAGTPEGQGCVALPKVEPGTAYLLQRGTCTFREKALNAQAAGASAAVLYNNQPGVLSPTVEGVPPLRIPVVMVSAVDGKALVDAVQADPATTITWTDRIISTPDPAGGLVSQFSSWGLAADLTLKPDLGAPGGNIWSTYPLEEGGYYSTSGTSMATPHAAGLVALLLEARPELKGKPERVQQLLMNTADPAAFSFSPDAGPDMVIRQGAGMADIVQAAVTKQSVSPAKISLGEAQLRPRRTTLRITNDSPHPVTYTISNLDGVGAVGPSDPKFDLTEATFSAPATVTVRGKRSALVNVSIAAPKDAPEGYVYGGWVVLSGDNGTTLRVPYAGMAGDYQALQAVPATEADFPWLIDQLGKRVTADRPRINFTMQGSDVPTLLFHLEYPVSDMQVFVYQAKADGTKGKQLGAQPVISSGNQGRDDLFTTLRWNGLYTEGWGRNARQVHAPAGNYVIELRVLKALGNPRDAKHWETWTSAAFSIGSGRVSPDLVQVETDPTGIQVAKQS